MTVITNMVVALMIVTSGEEPIQAIPIKPEPDVQDGWMVNVFGSMETLYRRTCKTNFVYSTTIKTGRIGTVKCRHRPCGLFHAYQPCDLFGHDIDFIGFRVDDWYCPAHKAREVAK